MLHEQAQKLAQADWSHPWWQSLRPGLDELLARVQAGDALHQALNVLAEQQTEQRGVDIPVRFVPQSALPDGVAYEQFVFEQKHTPVRENVHDFFHGLMWLQWPRSKARMNALQAQHIARHGVQGRRGALRDALTILDESGLVLVAPPDVLDDLRQRRWQQALFDKRALWRHCTLRLVGHAVYEKLLNPYKSIVAHVWAVTADSPCAGSSRLANASDASALDTQLADCLTPDSLIPKPFFPLPVLGIPGWWAANATAGFYADERVFRSLKSAEGKE